MCMPVNPVVNILNSLNSLSQETQILCEEIIEFRQLPKSTCLLSIGKVPSEMFFIHKGIARAYYFRNETDVTDYFAYDNQFIGATASLFKGVPSDKGIELLEDSEVYSFNYLSFDMLCSKCHDLERASGKLSTFAIMEEQERIESIRFLSAKERYWELERKYPGITNRVALKHIASYLNTTNVSLSRIRAGKQ